MAEQAFETSGAAELFALAAEIEHLRGRLGISEPFAPHARLLRLRDRRSENDPGEARLARTWLAELGG